MRQPTLWGVPGPDDLDLALELLSLADGISMARFRARDLVVESKPDLTPVTEADRAVERAIRERLAGARPGDTVLGEEYGSQPGGGRRWIIDPIDGTQGYVRGLPVWATLLALEEAGEVVLGAVSAPALGRRWWAHRGAGAHGLEAGEHDSGGPRRLRVSGVGELADAQLSFGGFEEWDEIGRLDALVSLGRRCWRTRAFGDFWSYMLLAEGTLDVALDPVASLWDLAAMQVIVEEAGGRFSDLSGRRTASGGSAVATNGRLHDAVLATLAAQAPPAASAI